MTDTQPTPYTENETNRTRRGHAFFPTVSQSTPIPPIYGTETIEAPDRIVYLHYFASASDWWITELDPETGLAYGYACLNNDGCNAEWGYVDLTELEALYVAAGPGRYVPTLIERDLHWTPTPLRDLHLPGRD